MRDPMRARSLRIARDRAQLCAWADSLFTTSLPTVPVAPVIRIIAGSSSGRPRRWAVEMTQLRGLHNVRSNALILIEAPVSGGLGS